LKGLLFFPILSCEKNTLPLELNFIKIAIIKIRGNPITKNTKENNLSKNDLKNIYKYLEIDCTDFERILLDFKMLFNFFMLIFFKIFQSYI
tara:strand:- start:734 stop:1006 length:273 start_codon:yes stop_codon:yes gene_type:complete